MALTDKLSAIASAIRTKTGTNDLLTLDQMPQAIEGIQTGSSDIPFAYGGFNAELIDTYEESWTLADTSFVVGSSASTSSTSIKASVSNRYTNTTGSPIFAYGDKDIIIVQKCIIKPTGTYTTGARQIWSVIENVTYFSKRKTNYDATSKIYRQGYSLVASILDYYSTSNVYTRASASYGFYMTPQQPSISSSTSESAYVKCSSPILYYRASSTYHSTTNMKLVTDCDFKWKVEVYAVDDFSSVCSRINDDISAEIDLIRQ